MTAVPAIPTRVRHDQPPMALRVVAILSVLLGLFGAGFSVGSETDLLGFVLDVLLAVIGFGLLARQRWARVAGWVLHGASASVGTAWTVIAVSHAIGGGGSGSWFGALLLGVTVVFSIWSVFVLRARPVRSWFEPRRAAARV